MTTTDLSPEAIEMILTDAENTAKANSTARALRSSLIEVHTVARQLQRGKQELEKKASDCICGPCPDCY
jgi:hypothetical protein